MERRSAEDGLERHVDLLVRNAHVVTMDERDRIIPHGAIAIDGRDILAVGDDSTLAARYTANRTIDAVGAPVHPGLVESHVHASAQTLRGAIPDQIAENDLFGTFFGPYFNSVTKEGEYFGFLLSALEMIRNGTTCFMEAGTVLEPEAAARAAEHVGIRALLGDAFIWDQPEGFAQGPRTLSTGPLPRPTIARAPKTFDEAIDRLGGELARNHDPNALVRGHIALLGLGTASQELLMEAKRRADDAGVVLNIHQSYSPADAEADRVRFGRDPLVHLAEIGFLGANVTLAHANYLTEAECDAILERGGNLAWAPAASMIWAHGGTIHGRHAELWRRGANIALGSDSGNWSNDFDLFKQAYLAMLTAREAHGDPAYLSAEDVLRMATMGGAQATGMQDQIGSIEPGKRADIVIHTLNRPEMIPQTDAIRTLVTSSRSKAVYTVVVDGRIILEEGSFTNLDEAALLAEINDAALVVLNAMGATPEQNRVAPRRGP